MTCFALEKGSGARNEAAIKGDNKKTLSLSIRQCNPTTTNNRRMKGVTNTEIN
jgi:hypothetical protein